MARKASTKPVLKQDPPALAKKEEKLHKDLDHDGEKGESPAHKAKVLGYSKAKQLGKKDEKSEKPAAFGGKQALPFGKKAPAKKA